MGITDFSMVNQIQNLQYGMISSQAVKKATPFTYHQALQQQTIEIAGSQDAEHTSNQLPEIQAKIMTQHLANHVIIKRLFNHKFAIVGLLIIIFIGYLSWKADYQHTSQEIYGIDSLLEIKQLPFCAVVFPNQKYAEPELVQHIAEQNYSNTKIIVIKNESIDYFSLKEKVKSDCIKHSLMVFVKSPLKLGAFNYLNRQFQHYKVWIAVSNHNHYNQVFAFFYRIYDLLQINDFNKSNHQHLLSNNRPIITQGLLQLCSQFTLEIERDKIINNSDEAYFFTQEAKQTSEKTANYTKILRLSQDYDAKISYFIKMKYRLKRTISDVGTFIDKKHLLRAVDRQQMLFLPQNHSIAQLQHEYFEQKYEINKYSDMKHQVRFCVTVLSHNNIENNRYIKVIQSITQQKYDNYHIVFFDDKSDDQTMQKSIEYFQKINFPKSRVKFVQNLARNFATYNILNSAFNFCDSQDVQILIDGDDQFIGSLVFLLFNSFYQRKPNLYMAYSNFKSNQFGLGLSNPTRSRSDRVFNGKRVRGSFMGPVRTWKVQLIRSIPMKYHQNKAGIWLDTGYDDALAHSLLQLSGIKRALYIPEVLYEYNTNYGDNDNANLVKSRHRVQSYQYLLSLPVLPELQNLSNESKDKQVSEKLEKDRDLKYKIVE